MGKLDRIADKIKGVVKGVEEISTTPKPRRWSGSAHGDDYAAANELKGNLLDKYSGSDLLTETDFEIVSNEFGKTLHSVEFVEKSFSVPDSCAGDILSDLKLIYGIGDVREKELKQEGYETIEELREHDKWGGEAKSIIDAFQSGELGDVYNLLCRWKSLSHPSFLRLSGLFERGEFAIVDIETMGLSNQPVFLLGLAQPVDSGIEVHQFLAEDLDQELATLVQFSTQLEGCSVILTYNGKNFDIPYIERRLSYYGQRKKFSHPHLDLYLFARSILDGRTKNCKLGTLERSILGVDRDVDIPSGLVPDFYKTYMEEKNPGPLVPILAHNRQDLLSLADLFHELTGEALDGTY